MPDPVLWSRVSQLHDALTGAGAAPARGSLSGETLEAESRLALIRERLHQHLGVAATPAAPVPSRLAGQLRDLLDGAVTTSLTLREAAARLEAHPDALVRSFSAAYGLPPHRYLIGRRIDLARRMLLAGQPVAEVAVAAGFADQPHLTRHFARQIGTTPARYASGRFARA
jgi:AraC-like DNA-binding protein